MEPDIIGGLGGGLLIGLASALMLLLIGRIAGISGILGGVVTGGSRAEFPWRLAFVAGLIGGGVLYRLLIGPLVITMQAEGPVLILAGLLVGFGTRIGSGCTSGHGVCGLARRSPRSLAATVLFIGVAALTVFITRHLLS
ncbi:MAG: YeeE/YedE family protein [Pseudomonadales bacterium]|nr:YeeE/YedE family protein [Pseudomonadales bacterium]